MFDEAADDADIVGSQESALHGIQPFRFDNAIIIGKRDDIVLGAF